LETAALPIELLAFNNTLALGRITVTARQDNLA
jgi:hypothetical protein